MACTGRYATADQYATLLCLDTPLTVAEQATIEAFLDLAAGFIHVARSSQNACDCTVAAGVDTYLALLNVWIAAVINRCPCGSGSLSDAEKSNWAQWAQQNLDAIRTGKLELCQGEMGSEFPYVAWAEQSLTDWATAQIILNAALRYP